MIRKARSPQDWKTIRELCCLTGNAGEPVSPERWPFFAENWIGPYQRLLPDWTWVATGSSDEVVGYLTGCPDTRALERKRRLRFDLPLLGALLAKRYAWNADTARYARRRLGLEHGPEHRFPAELQSLLRSQYPAHLHINLRADARKGGVGRELVSTYLTALRQATVPGIHVHCGRDPAPFYQRLDFQQLGKIEFAPGVDVFCLGLKL